MNQILLSKHAAEDIAAFPYGTIHAEISLTVSRALRASCTKQTLVVPQRRAQSK